MLRVEKMDHFLDGLPPDDCDDDQSGDGVQRLPDDRYDGDAEQYYERWLPHSRTSK